MNYELGQCELCDSDALALIFGAEDDQDPHHLCVMHTLAFMAPMVLNTMSLHSEHLQRVHGFSREDAAHAVAQVAEAIAAGNFMLFATAICDTLGLTHGAEVVSGQDDRASEAERESAEDMVRKIIDGTIDPGDFMQ